MDFFLKAIIFVIMISVIIIVHEGGHFLLGKRAGIGVIEFSLGIGPTLIGFSYHGTKYSLKLLPFGGACMFEGMDGINEDEEDLEPEEVEPEEGKKEDERSSSHFKLSDSPTAFPNAPVWGRIATVAAGPICNFLLAFVLALFIIGSIGYDSPTVGGVMDGYPAQAAGIQAGDEIVKLGNSRIMIYRDISSYTLFFQGKETDVTYRRDGQLYHTILTPIYDSTTGRYLFGISGSIGRTKTKNPLTIAKYSFCEVRYWVDLTFKSLGMIGQGRVTKDDVAGPVGVAQTVGQVYDNAKPDGAFYIWLNMMNLAILLSANLGVMNLLPLPALDGGRLVFLIIEAIRGKRVSPDKEALVHFAGFVILMIVMVLVLFNDISRFFR